MTAPMAQQLVDYLLGPGSGTVETEEYPLVAGVERASCRR